VTIAHRISTIIDYDLIVVMEQGRIVEMGEPDMLIRDRGAFWSLAVGGGAIAAEDAVGGSQL
jgi:ABC-type multidrug transport system fused ATPase/permease subunit